jgi:CspA family cold shock protein
MPDRVLTCAECGVKFVWTPPEQAQEPEAPARCPACRRIAPAPGRERGIVKWFSRARGYGFITPSEGPELFLHQSSMAEGQSLPRAGQLVEFGRATGPRGAQAADVTVLLLEAVE